MTKKAYIIGSACISGQHTIDDNWFFQTIKDEASDHFSAVEPSYKMYFDPGVLRRTGRAIRMGSVSAKMAIQDSQVETLDAIITGTGLGCFEDSEKFLLALLNNEEQFLTPTAFIQSTHNSVGSHIALSITCKDCNFTYSHRGFSFETCIADALMSISEGKQTLLVGSIEEYTPLHLELNRKAGKLSHGPQNTSDTPGIQMGEGSAFFVVSSQRQTAISCIEGIAFTYKPPCFGELLDKLTTFLRTQHLTLKAIDCVLLGLSGNKENDRLLLQLQKTISSFSVLGHFKHLSGEYPTAGAFGVWTANKIIQKQLVPDAIRLNNVSRSTINSVLIINGYLGINYSFTLLSKC